jgi:hypothetical protein
MPPTAQRAQEIQQEIATIVATDAAATFQYRVDLEVARATGSGQTFRGVTAEYLRATNERLRRLGDLYAELDS